MADTMIAEDVDPESIRQEVEAGDFPAGRLYLVIRRLDAFSGVWGARDVALLCYGICMASLEDKECPFNDDIKDLVLGFVDHDLLPTGETVRALWNKSPFDPLRNADPLPEEEENDDIIPVPLRPSLDNRFDDLFCSLGTYSAVCVGFLVTYCIAIVHAGGIPKY